MGIERLDRELKEIRGELLVSLSSDDSEEGRMFKELISGESLEGLMVLYHLYRSQKNSRPDSIRYNVNINYSYN